MVEVTGESNRDHDYETKRRDYASAGIPEYWIIDPEQSIIRIHRLVDSAYVLHGDFGTGTIATSPSLPGLSVDVSELFKQAAEQAWAVSRTLRFVIRISIFEFPYPAHPPASSWY